MWLQLFDIGIAYLNGNLIKEIYMPQPLVYIDHLRLHYVCLLLWRLYGQWQLTIKWNKTFGKKFVQFDLLGINADPCIYYNKGELHIIIGIHVDNGVIASTEQKYIDEIVLYLQSTFKVVTWMDYIIGFQPQFNKDEKYIFIQWQVNAMVPSSSLI